MRVGICFPSQPDLTSVGHIVQHLVIGLQGKHEVLVLQDYLGGETYEAPQKRIISFLNSCDVIFGTMQTSLLKIRNHYGITTPYCFFLLGDLTRGGIKLKAMLPHMNYRDRFIVNCKSDLKLLSQYTLSAQADVLPLSYDETKFYRDKHSDRLLLRDRYGFHQNDKIIIYAGRIKLSKNIHTLLKTFRAIHELVPQTHLIMAGVIDEKGGLFNEFGIRPKHFEHSLREQIKRIDIPESNVHLYGHVNSGSLRDLMSFSDVKINLTLHHDENFGLAQIEAMASGLPVIASSWGGLKDTIVDHQTGFNVDTRMTETGLHVNWLDAVQKALLLLSSPALLEKMRDKAHEHAVKFNIQHFSLRIQKIINLATHNDEADQSSPEASRFAEQIWSNIQDKGNSAWYCPSSSAFSLYAKLFHTYCGTHDRWLENTLPLSDKHLVCLSTPALFNSAIQAIVLDSPFYSFPVKVPPNVLQGVKLSLTVLQQHPVITISDLLSSLKDVNNATEVCSWMLKSLLIRMSSSSNAKLLTHLSPNISKAAFLRSARGAIYTDLVTN